MTPGQTSTPILRSSLNTHQVEGQPQTQPHQQQQQQPTPPPPAAAMNGTATVAPTNPFLAPVAAAVTAATDGLEAINLSSPPPELTASAMKKADFY
jgi:hypothetical protein